ncbi:calcium-binding protein [Methylobacterium trifolii]|uniref:Calcium-binding protein n=1 Tax=Methylobacterium trifolii TaxID=1003092 RepID=A0ABQ4TYE4_9HYPH|nr:calcium-binding protein [Methylobacterium trifolii]GJE60280.1 hypothetical protein MPOCJGCO_2391 [Methylobacterium trifolii]
MPGLQNLRMTFVPDYYNGGPYVANGFSVTELYPYSNDPYGPPDYGFAIEPNDAIIFRYATESPIDSEQPYGIRALVDSGFVFTPQDPDFRFNLDRFSAVGDGTPGSDHRLIFENQIDSIVQDADKYNIYADYIITNANNIPRFILEYQTFPASVLVLESVDISYQSSDVVVGTNGSEILNGTAIADTVQLLGGSDTFYGGSSLDTIYGGQGSDLLSGNRSADVIYGGRDSDTLYGGQGDDFVSGDLGDDLIAGDLGNDTLIGGSGADRYVFGENSGRDLVIGFDVVAGDRLDLRSQTYAIGTVANGDVRLTLSGGSTVQLVGVNTGTFGTGNGYIA